MMNRSYPLEHSPLYRLRNRQKLAKLLALPSNYFRVFRSYEYSEFSKPKSNGCGKRHFMNPEYELKQIQKKIHKLMRRIETPNWVKSAKKGESYISNCKAHLNPHYVLTIDIANFYDSASRKYIYQLFDSIFKMGQDISAIMTNLLMNDECLPTGAPSSQIIVFWAYREMFSQINRLAKKYDCIFTLYVDDMTFSSTKPISNQLAFEIILLLNKYGLTTKKDKIRNYTSKHFKAITGCGINRRGQVVLPNLKRKKLLDQFIMCQKDPDIKELEKLNGLYNSAKQIENNIFPSIQAFLKKHEPSLKEYARQRQKDFNARRKKREKAQMA